jgi:hypothetical protein
MTSIGKTLMMAHSIEEVYNKAKVLHDKALALHRERYRVEGWYDQKTCEFMLADIRSLARDIDRGLVDLDIDFGKISKINCT